MKHVLILVITLYKPIFFESSEDFSLIITDQVFIAANNESRKTKPTPHIPVTRSYNIHKEKPNNSLVNF